MALSLKPNPFVFSDELLVNLVNEGAADFAEPLYLVPAPAPSEVAPAIPAPVAQSHSTSLRLTNKELYYSRIHFTPNPFDFGTVIATDTHVLSVWNAFELTSHTLTEVAIGETPDGLTLLTELPLEFAPLEVKELEFSLLGTGLLSLAGQLEFDFDGLLASLLTAGNRSALFVYEHNWRERVFEKLRYDTEVLPAENGLEQRRRRRQYPERTLTQSFTLATAADSEKVKRANWRDQRSRMIVPVWSEAVHIDADIDASIDEIPFDTSGRDFDPGTVVLIFNSETDYQTNVIDSLVADKAFLQSGLVSPVAAGSLLVPLKRAFLERRLEWQEVTKHVTECTLAFIMPSDQASSYRFSAGMNLPEHRGFPLLLAEDQTKTVDEVGLEMNDLDVTKPWGDYRRVPIGKRPSTDYVINWLCADRAEVAAALAFVHYCQGRLKPFYWMTYGYNFELAADITAFNSQIVVRNWDYLSIYNVDDSRRDIAILLRDGTIYPRRIVAAEAGATADTERLSLDQPLPVDIAVNEVERVSFLAYARLGSDEVEFEWLPNDGCFIKLAIKRLEVSE